MKKIYLLIITFLCLFTLTPKSFAASPVSISPSKDTYISLSGALSEPNSNFGLADYIYVGDGWYGHCIGLFEFDLSSIPSSVNSYTFSCDMTAYGDETRTLNVFLLSDIMWNEVSITALNCPFDAYELWSTVSVNCTTVTFGSAQDDLNFIFTTAIKEKITLIFAFSPTIDSWITINAQENSYSWVNMAHLEYTPPIEPFDYSKFVIYAIGGMIGIVVFIVVYSKDRSKKKQQHSQVQSPQTLPSYGGIPPTSQINTTMHPQTDTSPSSTLVQAWACPRCGTLNILTAKFCTKCGKPYSP